MDREEGGALVRKAWVQWAERQPQPVVKPSWLVEWAELSDFDKEADRCIFDELWSAFQQQHLETLILGIIGNFQSLAKLLEALNTSRFTKIDRTPIISQIEQRLQGSGLRLDFDSEYDTYSLREK